LHPYRCVWKERGYGEFARLTALCDDRAVGCDYPIAGRGKDGGQRGQPSGHEEFVHDHHQRQFWWWSDLWADWKNVENEGKSIGEALRSAKFTGCRHLAEPWPFRNGGKGKDHRRFANSGWGCPQLTGTDYLRIERFICLCGTCQCVETWRWIDRCFYSKRSRQNVGWQSFCEWFGRSNAWDRQLRC